MRSILAQSHCRIPQRTYFGKKLRQSELKHQPGKLAIRVFSLCPMEKESPCSQFSDVDHTPNSQIAAASVRAKLGPAITKARSHANVVVCLVHWGIENSENITDEQRELARWLIDRGVDLVVGSHPHCVQPLDFYHGCPIAYSLGNLVFDGAPTVASWNRGALLEVGLNEGTRISSVSLIPVVLEDGFPHVEVTESNRFGSR
jgi:poly-gamma-glutamate capsule biosynthesis protein CapA/YwtB (metallophosphatase superfamily)